MTHLFDSLLIANRGEIACRIGATARRLGIRTVAVYSDADAGALHVALADTAVRIGRAPASDSYLKIDALIDAARRTGCNALHPGYGFLAENPALVEACEAAGIVFVGPDRAALAIMGRKDAAKRRMQEAGVPVVPGYHGEVQDHDRLAAEANVVGYPVLLKARAGGGGKGMRLVERAGALEAALDSVRREAAASFGDDRVLIEKYITCPRHIEVQVFGDRHGSVVHLFERDCSLQRRHQKVIEEAPAPGMTTAARKAMTAAAVTAAQSIGYVGAGTVEFIVDGSSAPRADGFWFMEMNTRLQVEHPVTEAITGYDLVEWQLRVAAGEPLPVRQADIAINGHAVEARLYAEDVPSGFLPASGRLSRLRFGDTGVRIDTGVREGDTVTMHYDPMIAKLIAHADTRERAFRDLDRELTSTTVLGTTTNREFLAELCRDPVVLAGDMTTRYIDEAFAQLTAADTRMEERALALGAACLAGWPTPNGSPLPSVANRLGNWSLWGTPTRQVLLQQGAKFLTLDVDREDAIHWRIHGCDGPMLLDWGGLDPHQPSGWVHIDGVRYNADVLIEANAVHVQLDGHAFRFGRPDPGAAAGGQAADQRVVAPMPGRITGVFHSVGEYVEAGTLLVTLEAMKMEQGLTAAADATIDAVLVAVDDQVAQGQELLRLEFSSRPALGGASESVASTGTLTTSG